MSRDGSITCLGQLYTHPLSSFLGNINAAHSQSKSQRADQRAQRILLLQHWASPLLPLGYLHLCPFMISLPTSGGCRLTAKGPNVPAPGKATVALQSPCPQSVVPLLPPSSPSTPSLSLCLPVSISLPHPCEFMHACVHAHTHTHSCILSPPLFQLTPFSY